MDISPRFQQAPISSNGEIVAIWCEGLEVIGFSMSTSALAGHSVNFEVSNDADLNVDTQQPIPGTGNWYSARAQRTNADTIETTSGVLAGTQVYGWMTPVAGWRFFRVLATAHTSGTALWTLFAAQGARPFYPKTSSTVLTTGTSLVGDVGHQVRATSGALALVLRLPSAAATTNATSVKASAGRLYQVKGYNAAASVRYLKLYNNASVPTVGTDTPVVTLALKAADVFTLEWADIGQYFSTGIAYAITTGSADADTGALTLGDVTGLNLWYS